MSRLSPPGLWRAEPQKWGRRLTIQRPGYGITIDAIDYDDHEETAGVSVHVGHPVRELISVDELRDAHAQLGALLAWWTD